MNSVTGEDNCESENVKETDETCYGDKRKLQESDDDLMVKKSKTIVENVYDASNSSVVRNGNEAASVSLAENEKNIDMSKVLQIIGPEGTVYYCISQFAKQLGYSCGNRVFKCIRIDMVQTHEQLGSPLQGISSQTKFTTYEGLIEIIIRSNKSKSNECLLHLLKNVYGLTIDYTKNLLRKNIALSTSLYHENVDLKRQLEELKRKDGAQNCAINSGIVDIRGQEENFASREKRWLVRNYSSTKSGKIVLLKCTTYENLYYIFRGSNAYTTKRRKELEASLANYKFAFDFSCEHPHKAFNYLLNSLLAADAIDVKKNVIQLKSLDESTFIASLKNVTSQISF